MAKTTLEVRDQLLREARRKAADEGRTLTSVVEEALATYLAKPAGKAAFRFSFPVVDGGDGPKVDVSDRDRLYDILEPPVKWKR
jgi:hypothetical protein